MLTPPPIVAAPGASPGMPLKMSDKRDGCAAVGS
jgi:hypothetical protein